MVWYNSVAVLRAMHYILQSNDADHLNDGVAARLLAGLLSLRWPWAQHHLLLHIEPPGSFSHTVATPHLPGAYHLQMGDVLLE